MSFTSASCSAAQRKSKPHMSPPPVPSQPPPLPEGQTLASFSLFLLFRGGGSKAKVRGSPPGLIWKEKQQQLRSIKICVHDPRHPDNDFQQPHGSSTVATDGGFDGLNQSRNQHLEANRETPPGSRGRFLRPH